MGWSKRSHLGQERPEWDRLRSLALGQPGAPRPGAVDLTCSNPTRVGLDLPDYRRELSVGAQGAYHPEPRGLGVARQAVAETYAARGTSVQPDQLCLLSSTSEGYSVLFHLLCDPGDSVLVPAPSYPLIDHLAQLAGVRLRSYQLRYAGFWQLDPSTLPDSNQIRREKIRAVVCVSPNNPTGSLMDAAEWRILQQLRLPLIVDEVFRPYLFGHVCPTQVLDDQQLVFFLDGLSKRAAAPGLKLGWIAACGKPTVVRDAMDRLEILADTFLSASGPVQRAAPLILHREREAQDLVIQRTRRTRALLEEMLEGTVLTLLPLQGGWSAIVRFPAIVAEAEWWEWLARSGVWLLPGELFSLPLSPAFVMSLLTPPEQMRRGMSRIIEGLRDLSSVQEASGRRRRL